MDTRVVVDTDVIIDFYTGTRRHTASRVRELLESDSLVITAVTLFELSCGANGEHQLKDIDQLAVAAAAILDVDGPAAMEAARIYRRLRTRGQTIATPDLLIAGCCIANALPLLTRNASDFSRIHGLALV